MRPEHAMNKEKEKKNEKERRKKRNDETRFSKVYAIRTNRELGYKKSRGDDDAGRRASTDAIDTLAKGSGNESFRPANTMHMIFLDSRPMIIVKP